MTPSSVWKPTRTPARHNDLAGQIVALGIGRNRNRVHRAYRDDLSAMNDQDTAGYLGSVDRDQSRSDKSLWQILAWRQSIRQEQPHGRKA